MTTSTEDGLLFLSRLRPVSDAIDSEAMANHLVLAIDLRETKLFAANRFLYLICKSILDKYEPHAMADVAHEVNDVDNVVSKENRKDSESDIESDEDIDIYGDFEFYEDCHKEIIEESVEERQMLFEPMDHQELSPSADYYPCAQRPVGQEVVRSPDDVPESQDDNASESSCGSYVSGDSCEDIPSLVMVFDATFSFNFANFRRIVSHSSQLKRMSYLMLLDYTQMMAAIDNEIVFNLGLNPDLKLVVIYANSSEFYPNIAEEIFSRLASITASVHFVVVFDKMSESLRSDLLKNKLFDILKVKSTGRDLIDVISIRRKRSYPKDLNDLVFKR